MGNDFSFSMAPVSWIIFILTIGTSLYTIFRNRSLLGKLMFSPYSFFHEKKWYTIVTSGFVHADIMHLIFNMLTFYYFAFLLEFRTTSEMFLIVYFGSMIIADLPTAFKNRDNYEYRSLGASGAISGLLFSSIIINPGTKIGILLFPFPMPASVFAVLYLIYCYFAARNYQDNINHSAHLWGALAGLVLTILLKPNSFLYFITHNFGL